MIKDCTFKHVVRPMHCRLCSEDGVQSERTTVVFSPFVLRGFFLVACFSPRLRAPLKIARGLLSSSTGFLSVKAFVLLNGSQALGEIFASGHRLFHVVLHLLVTVLMNVSPFLGCLQFV